MSSKPKSGKAAKPKPAKTIVKKKTKRSTPMQAGLDAVAAMAPKATKLETIIKLLTRPEGATVDDMTNATGWQKHTVRAALSHALGKKRGYRIASDKPKGGQRIYKIAEGAGDAK